MHNYFYGALATVFVSFRAAVFIAIVRVHIANDVAITIYVVIM